MATPFFHQEGERFQPTSVCAGPWDEQALHGRVVIGLLASELETAFGGDGFIPARMTVDMYRMPAFDAAEVRIRPIREGRRLRVAEAEYISGGRSMARATALFLLQTESPQGEVWGPPPWNAPSPDTLEDPPKREAGYQPPWDMRFIVGAMAAKERREVWLRDIRELVGGRPLSPFVRAALAADMASPIANSGSSGLKYINSDVTLYLHRRPTSDWIGLEVVDHGAEQGVANGACRLYDEAGPIGSVTVAALVQGSTL